MRKDWKPLIDKRCVKGNYTFLEFTEVKHGKQFLLVRCNTHNLTCEVRVDRFVAGAGCIKCRGKNIASNKKIKTTEEAVAELKAVHGDKFDLSKVDWKDNRGKITIGCPIHGYFKTNYQNFKRPTANCPSCTKYGFKPEQPAYLYVLTSENRCKVGITNNEVRLRVLQINQKSPEAYEVHSTYYFEDGYKARELEKSILGSNSLPFGDNSSYSGSTESTDKKFLEEILLLIGEKSE